MFTAPNSDNIFSHDGMAGLRYEWVMIKKVCVSLVALTILVGCTHFETNNYVKPSTKPGYDIALDEFKDSAISDFVAKALLERGWSEDKSTENQTPVCYREVENESQASLDKKENLNCDPIPAKKCWVFMGPKIGSGWSYESWPAGSVCFGHGVTLPNKRVLVSMTYFDNYVSLKDKINNDLDFLRKQLGEKFDGKYVQVFFANLTKKNFGYRFGVIPVRVSE